MFDRLRAIVLWALRVPPEPTPPLGAPGSVRVFRAGRNLFRLRLAEWGLTQAGAALGVAVSIYLLLMLQHDALDFRARRERAQAEAAAQPAAPGEAPAKRRVPVIGPAEVPFAWMAQLRQQQPYAAAVVFTATLPPWAFPLVNLLKVLGVAALIAQLPFSYAAVRLEYEQHWYVVTDRSLRIRSGLVSMLESTMSFANLQQVVVHQGPVQRLLGIADVRVQSAGGGGDQHEREKHGDSLHVGIFRGVDNANEIRDLILERVRRFRETGLGDSDERRHATPAPGAPPAAAATGDALAAARELLGEARALRAALR